MPIDQQIIKYNVDRVRGYIGTHCDLGVPRTSLGGINPHLNAVEDHASHDNSKVSHCAVMGFHRGTTQPDDGIRQQHK